MKASIGKRGQISLEYLITVGFIVFLIIGILGVSLFYSSLIKDNIRMNHLRNFANKVISSSESVFYAGEPSLTTITAYLPSGVEGIYIGDKQIYVNISAAGGTNRVSFSSNVPINGSISKTEGVKKIKISATRNYVNVTETA
ncbi:MAG: hypothetical protein Q7S27_03615 [Nanoarchaeota archaeon]|nr:hypothetical protein [Nanoarchaeota archaeon]